MRLHTRIGDFGLAFWDADTLMIGLPSGAACGLHFEVPSEYQPRIDDCGRLTAIRRIQYETNGTVLRSDATEHQAGCVLEYQVRAGADSAIALRIGHKHESSLDLGGYSEARERASRRWSDWFSGIPDVAEPYRAKYAYAWWIMASNLVQPRGNLCFESMMPSKITYVGAWLWDSALHALAFRHMNMELARDQLRVLLANQLPDGMLPDAVFDEGIVSEIDHPIPGSVTKPPIFSWAAWKLHQTAPSAEFLEEVYEPLVRLNRWWRGGDNLSEQGLSQYSHPYSSGLDDSPLWDAGMPVIAPDLNTYLCLDFEALGNIAQALGLADEALEWRQQAQILAQRIREHLWDESAGVFRALRGGQPIQISTPFELYPLWTGRMPESVAERLVANLLDPARYWGAYPIPTVGRDDPHHAPETMWRGPIWANVNYFFVNALERAGRSQLANQLREKTLRLIMGAPGIREYYSAETGQPPASAANMFGWTAAVFIEMALGASLRRPAHQE